MDRGIRLGGFDAVQQQVHSAQPGRQVRDLPSRERPRAQGGGLVGFQRRETQQHRPVSAQQESAGAARRVADLLPGSGLHHVHHRGDQRSRGEILSRTPGAFLRGLLYQPLISVAFHIGVVAQPLMTADEVLHQLLGSYLRDMVVSATTHDADEVLHQLLQFRRGLDAVAGLVEHHPQHVVARAQLGVAGDPAFSVRVDWP